MSDFKTSLEVGKETERYVLQIIQKKYPSAYMIAGYCKEYDIYIPELSVGVEVKKDKKSIYTGNIVVEIEFNGKPSALSTTKADYWVFYDEKELIWTTPGKLRTIVKDMKPATFIGKGDTVSKKAYLVKKKIIKDNSITSISKSICVFCNKPQKTNNISKCSVCDWKMCLSCFSCHLIACDQVMDNYQQQLRIEWND